MILTTTHSIENFKIVDYLGIVTGTAYESSFYYEGNKMSFKDMFSTEKHYKRYSDGIEFIKEKAFQNLKENALKLKANAVVGILIDIEKTPSSSVVLVSVTGTAVKVE